MADNFRNLSNFNYTFWERILEYLSKYAKKNKKRLHKVETALNQDYRLIQLNGKSSNIFAE